MIVDGFQVLIFAGACLILGALILILWAFAHEESDEEDDNRREKAIREIERRIDDLRKDE